MTDRRPGPVQAVVKPFDRLDKVLPVRLVYRFQQTMNLRAVLLQQCLDRGHHMLRLNTAERRQCEFFKKRIIGHRHAHERL